LTGSKAFASAESLDIFTQHDVNRPNGRTKQRLLYPSDCTGRRNSLRMRSPVGRFVRRDKADSSDGTRPIRPTGQGRRSPSHPSIRRHSLCVCGTAAVGTSLRRNHLAGLSPPTRLSQVGSRMERSLAHVNERQRCRQPTLKHTLSNSPSLSTLSLESSADRIGSP